MKQLLISTMLMGILISLVLENAAEARRTAYTPGRSRVSTGHDAEMLRVSDMFGNPNYGQIMLEIEAGYFNRTMADKRRLQSFGGELTLKLYPRIGESNDQEDRHLSFLFFMALDIEPTDHRRQTNTFIYQSFFELGTSFFLLNSPKQGFLNVSTSLNILRQDPHDSYFGILAGTMKWYASGGLSLGSISLSLQGCYMLGIAPGDQRIEGYRLTAQIGLHFEKNLDLFLSFERGKVFAKGFAASSAHTLIYTDNALSGKLLWHISGNVGWVIVDATWYIDSHEKISNYRPERFQILTGLRFSFT